MTVTLQLKPEVEAGLLAQAEAHGVALEDYLIAVVERIALQNNGDSEKPTGQENWAEAVRRMLEFSEKHRLSLGNRLPAVFCTKVTDSDGGVRAGGLGSRGTDGITTGSD